MAFKLERTPREGTGEVTRIQEKGDCMKARGRRGLGAGAARERAEAGHTAGGTGEAACGSGMVTGHGRLGTKSEGEGKTSEDVKT